ncbi:DUF2992 family protein [Paenibacillus lautus]
MLTVLFAEYWIGVTEQEEQGRLKACRHIFGNEPKDPGISLAKKKMELMNLTKVGTDAHRSKNTRVNPKRLAPRRLKR